MENLILISSFVFIFPPAASLDIGKKSHATNLTIVLQCEMYSISRVILKDILEKFRVIENISILELQPSQIVISQTELSPSYFIVHYWSEAANQSHNFPRFCWHNRKWWPQFLMLEIKKNINTTDTALAALAASQKQLER